MSIYNQKYAEEERKLRLARPFYKPNLDKMNTVSIEVKDVENVISDLADLTCWWEGFTVGLKFNGNENNFEAEHGVKRVTELVSLLKKAINNK